MTYQPCTVDALARLQLTAQRLRGRVQIRGARRDLLELLALTGLADVVPGCALAVGRRGEAEAGEQAGVQEVVHVRDPAGGDLEHLK